MIRQQKHLRLEKLEDRTLMAADAALVGGGVLHVEGTVGDDVIQIEHANMDTGETYTTSYYDKKSHKFRFVEVPIYEKAIRVHISGVNGEEILDEMFARKDVDLIMAYGGDGDDTIDLNNLSVSSYMEGGDGDDTLIGGILDDEIFGQDGDDEIIGKSGDDLLVGGLGIDIISGGKDNDELYAMEINDFVGSDAHFLGSGDQLSGGSGNDDLWGSTGADLLDGGAGDDTLLGFNGKDILIGGDGNDVLSGGKAADVLFGMAGDDDLYGDYAPDTFGYGGLDFANDVFFGGSGSDHMYDRSGNILLGGAIMVGDRYDNVGNLLALDSFAIKWDMPDLNQIEMNHALDLALHLGQLDHGDDGDDYMEGSPFGYEADVMWGDGGNDTLIGNNGNDQLDGGAGDDTLVGGGGVDILKAEGKDNEFYFDYLDAWVQYAPGKDMGVITKTIVATGKYAGMFYAKM